MFKGIIVAYSEDAKAGIIQTEDLEPHYFARVQWRSDVEPRINMKVTFEEISGSVRNVRLAEA